MTGGGRSSEFHTLYQLGLDANGSNNFTDAAVYLQEAYTIASSPKEQADALNPWARSLWNQGDYTAAHQKLVEAQDTAAQAGLTDEAAIATSNIARLRTLQALDRPWRQRGEFIRAQALPSFAIAAAQLKEVQPRHLYYDYTTAGHGALAAAMAGERKQALGHIATGISVAFQEAQGHDVGKRPAFLHPKGLGRLAVAVLMLPLGEFSPLLPPLARRLLK